MRIIQHHNQFIRDMKRIQRSGACTIEDIKAVVTLLQTGAPLLDRMKDHPLKGSWAPARECHIRPDVLLVYEKTPTALHLLRLGSHAKLFRK